MPEDLDITTLATSASVVNGSGTLNELLMNGNLTNINEEDELKLLNFPSKREDLTTAIPLTVIFALLLVTGCIGNMCTAIVIARPKNKYMHTATNYYLFSLAMSDFLFLILGLPQEMYTLWQRYPYAFGESFCVIRGYMSEASTYASILTISAFTIERYVAICHPLWAHTMSQLPRAITSIVIIWILAAICAIPPAAELGIVTQKGPITNKTLDESAQCATKRSIYENMFVVSAIVFFIVPMIIVTVLYILIAIELRRSSKMNSAMSKQTSSHLYSQQSPSNSNSNQHHQHRHHRHHHHQHHHKLSALPHCCMPIGCSTQLLSDQHNRLTRGNTRAGTLNPSASLGFSQTLHDQVPLATPTKATATTEPPSESIMANIMSQRPSSVIGTEQLPIVAVDGQTCCDDLETKQALACTFVRRLPNGGPKGKRPLSMWPLYWNNSQQQRQQKHPCHCCLATGCQIVASNKATGLHLSQSHQYPANCESVNESHESIERRHSPLSYHESLIHHQANINIDNSISTSVSASACNNNKLRLFPTHQMSLTHSPFYQSNSARNLNQAACQQQKQQHHLHQHHHHHGNQSRRSAAASSKKSVIRMLVAVVVSFFICWVPFHAQRLLASYLTKDENQNQLLLDIYLKLTYISGVMYYLSSTINPLLYQLMSAKFRLAFKETFNCSLFKCFMLRRSAGSPTNSLKESNVGHLRQLPHLDSRTSQLGPEISGLYADCSCHLTAEAECPTLEGHANNNNSSLLSPAVGSGVLARVRGKLNTSLVSLFRLNSNESSSGGCPCCTNQRSRYIYSQLSESCCATSMQNDNLLRVEAAQRRGIIRQSGSGCVSTPLLACHQDAAECQTMLGSQPDVSQMQSSAAANISSTFPAQSMLKFIRGPTPLCGVQPSLTRLSSREEEELSNPNSGSQQQRKQDETDEISSAQVTRLSHSLSDKMVSLIKPTDMMIDDGCCSNEQLHIQSLTMTSESGNSTAGSSPDQQQMTIQPTRQHRYTERRSSNNNNNNNNNNDSNLFGQNGHQRQKVSSGSSNGSGAAVVQEFRFSKGKQNCEKNNKPKRRASFQAEIKQTQQSEPLGNRFIGANQRRKSSSSSNKHFSSSLSSSERHLDKKLSMSTTTSAIDDCGSFTTTTNSHLTNGDSNPALTTHNEASLSRHSSSAIEEDPATVINIHPHPNNANSQRHLGDAIDNETNSIANEIKLHLLTTGHT